MTGLVWFGDNATVARQPARGGPRTDRAERIPPPPTTQPPQEAAPPSPHPAPSALTGGGHLPPVPMRSAVSGPPNARRDNVILVCHALSGSARVADWWAE